MGWSLGYDEHWKRDVGYGVPANCDHPGCKAKIDRGLGYVCGSEPFGGDAGCGLFFCSDHLHGLHPHLCDRCAKGEAPYTPTPDHPTWLRWKLRDESWSAWRKENPDTVQAIRVALGLGKIIR